MIHKCSVWPDTTAGATDRLGFILAPLTGPLIILCTLLPVATLMITGINKKVWMNISIKN